LRRLTASLCLNGRVFKRQESPGSRGSLWLLSVVPWLLRERAERPRHCRAAHQCDEVAPSHEKLPIEDKAYQRVALCVTTKWDPQMTLWVNRSRSI
jgi:hypothetical protein